MKLMNDFYGYVHNQDGIIYHVPEVCNQDGIIYDVPKNVTMYAFPHGTTGLSQTAIMELRNAKVMHIIVPRTFKIFNYDLQNFKYLEKIELQEGVEEVKCRFDNNNVVDIKLPSTIKRIGAKNYPVVKDLVLPKGVIEIEQLFASHDTNLVSVDIPGTLKVIPKGAFNQCKNLQKVILDEGVETSMLDAFRGTNNLHTLVLPSTYNGKINLPMDPRGITSLRGNSKYDGKRFAEEQEETLKIKITRSDDVLGYRNFMFNIRRGDISEITINKNIIKIRCINNPQIINIDCEQIEEGTYNIQNGNIELQKAWFSKKSEIKINNSLPADQKTTSDESQKQEEREELDTIFQSAYRDNITTRDDFKQLPYETKKQVKKQIKVLFLELNKQFGTPPTSYEMFDYLYSRALNEIKLKRTSMPEQEIRREEKIDNAKRKKLHRPHIKKDVIRQVKLAKIEEDKDSLRKQKKLIFEQQRQALKGQMFQPTEMLLDDEPEENKGMSM